MKKPSADDLHNGRWLGRRGRTWKQRMSRIASGCSRFAEARRVKQASLLRKAARLV